MSEFQHTGKYAHAWRKCPACAAERTREHIAAEVLAMRPASRCLDTDLGERNLAQRVYYDAITDVAARIARGGTDG